MSLWWLSFIDPDRSTGQKFLGVSIVADDGDDCIASAASNAHRLGCNPGGEVQGVMFSNELAAEVYGCWCNRILTKAEAQELDQLLARAQMLPPGLVRAVRSTQSSDDNTGAILKMEQDWCEAENKQRGCDVSSQYSRYIARIEDGPATSYRE